MVFPSYIFMHYVLDPDNFRHSTCTKQHYYTSSSIQSNSLNSSRQSILKCGNWRHNSLQILHIIAYYLFTFNHHFLYIFSDLKFLSLCKRERERERLVKHFPVLTETLLFLCLRITVPVVSGPPSSSPRFQLGPVK